MKHTPFPLRAASHQLQLTLAASCLLVAASQLGGAPHQPPGLVLGQRADPQLQTLLSSAVNAVNQQQQQQQQVPQLQPAQVAQLNQVAQQASHLYGNQMLEAVSKANHILQQQRLNFSTGPLFSQMVGPNGTTLLETLPQTELLRQEIVRRAGDLQQIVSGSLDMLKTSSDTIVRRLLEQMHQRLELAKARADKISSEAVFGANVRSGAGSQGSELASRALATINQGLNNLQNIISNIVTRLEPVARAQPPEGTLDVNKFRRDLQQLHQNLQAALQQQRQQQQQQQLLKRQ